MRIREEWIDEFDTNDVFYTKDETISSVKSNFDYRRYHSAEGETVLIDNSKEQVLIQDHTNPLNEFRTDKKIHCALDSSIKRGSYVKWKNNLYLVLSEINDNGAYLSGKITKVNYNLKWIDNTSILIQKPCIVSAKTLYTTGVRDEKVIEIPNGMVGIQLPYDEDTKNLNREQGFIFNKTKYKITFYNEVEFDGLIILLCSEIGFNTSVDDMENEIADRWIDGIDRLEAIPDEPTEPEEPIGDTFTYFIDGVDSIMWNQTKTFTVHKYDNNVEINGVFALELIGDYADIVDTTDNTIDIKAKNNVYGYVTLKAIDTETSNVLEKQILIKGLI